MKKSLIALAALASMGVSASAAFARKSADDEHGHEHRALNAGGLLANIDSATLNKNDFMQAFGNCAQFDGQVAVASAPAATDVIRIMKILAGTKVQAVMIGNTDMDTGGTALAISLGYAPVVAGDGPAASAAYFGAAGDTVLTAANNGKMYCNFDAITFDKDVYLTATVGVIATTFAAGTIRAVVTGEARGIK